MNIMNDTLILKRFCGEEQYTLLRGTWSIDDGVLSIVLSFGSGINLHEDTEDMTEEPDWNLYFK